MARRQLPPGYSAPKIAHETPPATSWDFVTEFPWYVVGLSVFLWWSSTGWWAEHHGLTSLFFFGSFVPLGVLAVGYWQRRRYDDFIFDSRERYEAEYSRKVDRMWRSFERSRPLALVARDRAPLSRATAEIMRARNGRGTVLLGTTPDIEQLFIAAGSNESIAVVAPSQAGKTTGLAIPAVLTHPGSVIAATVKGDVLRATAQARGHRGPCFLFDPLGSIQDSEIPSGSNVQRIHWSPLSQVTGWDSARKVAASLVGAAGRLASGSNSMYWTKSAVRLVGPYLLAAALHEDASMNDVSRWISKRDFDSALAILSHVAANDCHPSQRGAKLAIDSLASFATDQGPEHLAGIFGMATTALDIYNSEAIQAGAEEHNFDVDSFVRSGNQTLYICAPQVDQELSAPLNVALLDSIFRTTESFDREVPFATANRAPVFACLDEVRNIAPTPHLPTYLSTGLGQGFQTMVFLQYRAQAKAVWGDEGEAIFDNATTKVIMGGWADPAAMEALSLLTGDINRTYTTTGSSYSYTEGENWGESSSTGAQGTSRGRSTGGSTSTTHGTSFSSTYRKERLLSAADIAATPKGQARVIRHRTVDEVEAGVPSSILVDLRPSYEEPFASVLARVGPSPTACGLHKIESSHQSIGISIADLSQAFTTKTMTKPQPNNVKGGKGVAHSSPVIGGLSIAFEPVPVHD